MHFLNGFAHKDQRFHFRAEWKKWGPYHDGMPDLPDHFAVIDEATERKPFRLVTAPARNFLNTSFTETATSQAKEKAPTLQIHYDDAKSLSITDGDIIRVGNERGEVELAAKLVDHVQRGVVICESVWPGTAFKGGVGINALTSADRGLPNGGAVFHDTAVWIESAG